jgi:hypothetical protein
MLCPHCTDVFCIYIRTNSDLSHLRRKVISFYNRDEMCLQRGTDWVFTDEAQTALFKGLKSVLWELLSLYLHLVGIKKSAGIFF